MGTAVWVPHETDVWQPGVIESRTDLKDGGIELTVSLPRAGRVETFQFGADFDELECETLKLRNTRPPRRGAPRARRRGRRRRRRRAAARDERARAPTSSRCRTSTSPDPRRAAPALRAGLIYERQPILLAINPFKRLPTLYSSATLHEYRAAPRAPRPRRRAAAAAARVRRAEGAYRAMRVAMVERAAGRGADELCDQSILVRARGRAGVARGRARSRGWKLRPTILSSRARALFACTRTGERRAARARPRRPRS